ncbi:MAG: peptidoglycan DD-metalloendopeptidase family protein [Acidimicrobiia bacterium]|nr:peptidoglycan DD-metalloendopeptidase family protein [Acidimicrobiia bacterium]
MKLLAAPALAVVVGLLSFPVLFATGDTPRLACAPSGEIDAILATIRTLESGADYTARASGSSASGAYQFTDATWAGWGGYTTAWQAPPYVQDQKAIAQVQAILDANDGDVSAIGVVWFLGHLPRTGPRVGHSPQPRRRQHPHPSSVPAAVDDRLRDAARTHPSRYQRHGWWRGCLPGTPIEVLADGYAYPAPLELFATAPVDAAHHDYPAWDWGLPSGTPIYAVRGGTVTAVPYWPDNWWDHGCGTHPDGCQPCGIGVTIDDDAGNRWNYCHGNAVHVQVGDTVTAGTQILSSGNTGRSSGPHLHLQIRTPDGRLRCPQPLLRSLRHLATGIDPTELPTTGCSY